MRPRRRVCFKYSHVALEDRPREHFCLQDEDEHDAFSNCDSITVLRAPSGAQLHVYYGRETESPQPGLIMRGNPAGFLVQEP